MARNSWKNYASIGALAVAGGFSLSSFMNEQSDVSTFDLPPEVSVMTIQEFRDGMTMAHFSKIRGIADILLENGATFSPATEMRVRYASKIAEMKYAQYEGNDHMQMSFDMARSEGEMEARQGEWSIAALDAYAKQAMELDQRFVSVADAAVAYLQDEGISSTDAEAYVRRSIGLAYHDNLKQDEVSVAGYDPRMEITEVKHAGVVFDLHEKMHAFFQNRLGQLDVADDAFLYMEDQTAFIEAAVSDDETTPEMEM